MPWIIRTSDRGQFKSCRRAWNFGSKIRQNLEWKGLTAKPLDFGTAIHRGLEVFYNPETWSWDRELVQGLSLKAFVDKQHEQLDKYRLVQPDVEPEVLDDFKEREVLGLGMLKNYFSYSASHDTGLTPRFVETEFEVPIPVPNGLILPHDFSVSRSELWYQGEQVVYQGRIDLIWEEEEGYFVTDHKTAARFEETTEFLELDEQVGSYAWATREMLGLDVKGVVYNQLYKGVPDVPQTLNRPYKDRWLSTNKQQDTTYDLFKATALTEDPAGLTAGLYDDYLQFLKYEGKIFNRRIRIHRSGTELTNLGYQICYEAIDMLNDPFIYPNPSPWKCKGCAFRLPCLATNDGSDVGWILKEQYQVRKKETV